MSTNIKDALSIVLIICSIIITGIVVEREFIGATNSSSKVQYIEEWQQLASKGHRSGPQNAPVQIIEFFDYQCASCHRMEHILDLTQKLYSDRVSIVRRYLPLSNLLSYPSSIAAECAARQGFFASFHDTLFENHGSLTTAPLDSLARLSGLPNVHKFNLCVIRRETSNIVDNSINYAQEYGIGTVPTVIINGNVFYGVVGKDELFDEIDKYLD